MQLHAEISLLDAREVGGGGAPGGERRGGRLDDAPRLDEAVYQRFVAADVRVPREDQRIQEIPIVAAQHAHADPSPRLQQALGRENLDGFADRRAAHAEFFGKIVLARQQVVRGVDAGQNPLADRGYDRIVHRRREEWVRLYLARDRSRFRPPPALSARLVVTDMRCYQSTMAPSSSTALVA